MEIGVFEGGEPREATWVQLGSTWAPKRSPGRPKAEAKKGAKEREEFGQNLGGKKGGERARAIGAENGDQAPTRGVEVGRVDKRPPRPLQEAAKCFKTALRAAQDQPKTLKIAKIAEIDKA